MGEPEKLVSADEAAKESKKWQYEELGRRAVESLKRNGMNALFVPGRQEALAKVLEMVPEGATVGRGDSMTVMQVGILPALKSRGRNEIIDPFPERYNGDDPTLSPQAVEKRHDVMRQVLLTDVYITGTNAITLDGKLVSIDALGNRVAAMIYGPKKVIIVAGANKIVPNLEQAIARVKNVAAPLVSKRHDLYHWVWRQRKGKAPCEVTGYCADCKSDWRLCCFTVIIERDAWLYKEPRLNVVIVGEELGL